MCFQVEFEPQYPTATPCVTLNIVLMREAKRQPPGVRQN
jgi:hypothetical protein